MNINRSYFGETPERQAVYEYELSNGTGFQVKIITYGGTITEISAPDINGVYENVVLGFDRLEPYLYNAPYFGAIVGRTSGRISNAAFELNGIKYELGRNDGANNLHGGKESFSRKVWEARESITEDTVSLHLSYRSKDMEEGFPGNLDTEVTYTIDCQNRLVIDYKSRSDKDTLAIFTNHSYFNLSGNVKRSALSQSLIINAREYITVDPCILPQTIEPVDGTPFDFREANVIGEVMDFGHEQIRNGKGYDHPFILNGTLAAVLTDKESKRQMTIETTEPCIVFYAGGYIGNTWTFKEGVQSKDYDGICLETQWYTDAMNSSLPKRILRAGELYESQTIYTFGITKP